jgi:hypothetical protein
MSCLISITQKQANNKKEKMSLQIKSVLELLSENSNHIAISVKKPRAYVKIFADFLEAIRELLKITMV